MYMWKYLQKVQQLCAGLKMLLLLSSGFFRENDPSWLAMKSWPFHVKTLVLCSLSAMELGSSRLQWTLTADETSEFLQLFLLSFSDPVLILSSVSQEDFGHNKIRTKDPSYFSFLFQTRPLDVMDVGCRMEADPDFHCRFCLSRFQSFRHANFPSSPFQRHSDCGQRSRHLHVPSWLWTDRPSPSWWLIEHLPCSSAAGFEACPPKFFDAGWTQKSGVCNSNYPYMAYRLASFHRHLNNWPIDS